jgi:hypothetical protein
MSKTAVRLGAVALSAAVVVGVGGASALAATPAASPASLSTVQAIAGAAITLRVNDLNAAISTATSAKQLGSSMPTLVSYLQADIAPLQALQGRIAGDTSVAAARADAVTIFTNYRVLALVLPAAHLAGISDGMDLTVIPNLTSLSAKATSYVNASNQAVLQPLIDDMNTQIGAATTASAGVAATVLAYAPSQWNSNHDLLAPSRGSVQASVKDITTARSDANRIRDALKAAKASSRATPTTAS